MRSIFSLLIFMFFINQAMATEVNGSFKDECKYFKNQIEKDIASLAEEYTENFEAASVINEINLKKMLDYYITLCD